VRLTYEELDQKSNALARGLREIGVSKGDRVAVSLGNNIEFAVATYAIFKLGAILVPLNPAFNTLQVVSALGHLSASHLVIGAETNLPFKKPRSNIELLKSLVPDLESGEGGRGVESAAVPSLKRVVVVDNSAGRIDTSRFSALTPFSTLWSPDFQTSSVTPAAPLHPDETINIQFTSGTTALPKAAQLSHLSILNNGFSIGSRMRLSPQDTMVVPPPLFHCFGCILGYMATATHGSAICFPSEAFDPAASLLAVQEERASGLYGVATMFAAELELLSSGKIRREGFENLRTGIAAGSSVPSVLMEQLHRELNLTELTICYGMTETSPVSFMTKPDDPLEKRLDTVGSLLPHVSAKVVSEGDPTVLLPVGEKGELAVAGYNVMSGYYGDELRTLEARRLESSDPNDPDSPKVPWMYTGDEALMTEDGYVKITGRIKDLIIRGGENIHPLEVENALFAHSQVREASVVGLPDEKYGECVAAFVVVHGGVVTEEPIIELELKEPEEIAAAARAGLSKEDTKTPRVDGVGVDIGAATARAVSTSSPCTTIPVGASANNSSNADAKHGEVLTKAELREWVRNRLSGHLVPKYVFFVKEYPKTPSGKIQKFKLKAEGIRLRDEGKGL
jgi:acyl-CoA synthetase (AMP-forming)/AMP-acid ligase II